MFQAFLRWANSRLRGTGTGLEVSSLAAGWYFGSVLTVIGFSSGVALCRLFEVVSNSRLGFSPSSEPRVLLGLVCDKVNLMLGFGSQYAPESFLEGNILDILKLLWIVIMKFEIETVVVRLLQEESPTQETSGLGMGRVKRAFLQTVQKITAEYDGVVVKDFGSSWKSGLAFGAVLCSFDSSLLDFDALQEPETAWLENLKKVLVAAGSAGIPRIIDPVDLLAPRRLSTWDQTVMLYVATMLRVLHDRKLSVSEGVPTLPQPSIETISSSPVADDDGDDDGSDQALEHRLARLEEGVGSRMTAVERKVEEMDRRMVEMHRLIESIQSQLAKNSD